MRPILRLATLAALSVAAPLRAQEVRIITRPDQERHVIIDRRTQVDEDRPMLGVTTAAESERSDTLGLRIESVVAGSPAEKAGLKAGDRLHSVGSVSLRADRNDAGEDDYSGVLNRRLLREVQRTKPGESLELRVLTGAQLRTVRVTPVASSALTPAREGFSMFRRESGDRAVLGLSVAGTGTIRDTAGVFVLSVTKDGPAEKAGMIEGDRIAAINGVSLKVAREDAVDEAVGASRAERLSREVAKLKAGDAAELTVVSGGRARTVRVTAVKASDLPEFSGEWKELMPARMPMLRRSPHAPGATTGPR